MATAHTLDTSIHPELQAVARQADLVMLLTLVGSCLAALAIAQSLWARCRWRSASRSVCWQSRAWPSRPHADRWSRPAVLTACNVVAVALHIQLGRGTLEFHFGVFVLLGLLLVYRDWRPIVLAAGLFAVHHVVFDRLQALNWGVYCTPEANFLKTLMHAVYVVVQTSIEFFLAMRSAPGRDRGRRALGAGAPRRPRRTAVPGRRARRGEVTDGAGC